MGVLASLLSVRLLFLVEGGGDGGDIELSSSDIQSVQILAYPSRLVARALLRIRLHSMPRLHYLPVFEVEF